MRKPREPGVGKCPKCKKVWDIDVIRERPDYVPGECPNCKVWLKSIPERK
jgi:phage FluMu protein Com